MRKICVLVSLFVLLAALLLTGCGRPRPPEETAAPSATAEDISPVPAVSPVSPSDATTTAAPSASAAASAQPVSGSAVLTETADMGQDYIDKITFLGDSTTYGLRYYAMLNGGKNTTQVWTPSSGTLTLSQQSFALIVYPEDNTEITILEAVARKKPEMMVITLGVNGVSFMDEDYFKSEYTSLIEGIQSTSPNTTILLQSIFPVARSYKLLNSINNEKITRANGWILDIAKETGVRYLDTQSVLKDSEGWLPEEYQNGDGLHLNPTSFALVLDYIRCHGYQ